MKTFKVGDTIPFRVRCNGDPAVDNPTATIYDEANAAVVPDLTIGAGLTQVPGTKIVTGSFVADVAGQWSVSIVDDAGMDLVKEFIVRGDSIESIGSGVTALNGGIVGLDGKIDAQDLVLAAILNQTQGGAHFG
jgi:hypothetical protein